VIFAGQLIVGSSASRNRHCKATGSCISGSICHSEGICGYPKGNVAPDANPDVCIVVAPEHKSVPIGAV
jgi:hypothetical protein